MRMSVVGFQFHFWSFVIVNCIETLISVGFYTVLNRFVHVVHSCTATEMVAVLNINELRKGITAAVWVVPARVLPVLLLAGVLS